MTALLCPQVARPRNCLLPQRRYSPNSDTSKPLQDRTAPMSGATVDPRYVEPRKAPRKGIKLSWSDPRMRAIVWQVVILGIVGCLGWYLAHNTTTNLAARRIATRLALLNRTEGIPNGARLI